MPIGISHNHLLDFGVIINIPDTNKGGQLINPRDGSTKAYPGNKYFDPRRIVIDFDLVSQVKQDPGDKFYFPAYILVLVEEGDLLPGETIDVLNIADQVDGTWNVLDLNLERWMFQSPINLGSKTYIGYIKADAYFPGDPPVALGT